MTVDKTKRLGRGLEALFGAASAPVREAEPGPIVARDEVRQLPIAAISPNPFQPRREFRPDELAELEASMRDSGLLQPITVRRTGDSLERFELIAGERRFRAASRLGWIEIPALIKQIDDRAMLSLALVENLQRADLNPIDEALGVQRLVTEFALTQQQVADVLGKDRSTIANLIRVLALPAGVQRMIVDRQLTLGHARALLMVGDQRTMLALAREAADEQLSVRDVERRARQADTRTPGPSPAKAKKSPHAPAPLSTEQRHAVDALRRLLQTDVKVTTEASGRGSVSIAFYSPDDLARLFELMLPGDSTGE